MRCEEYTCEEIEELFTCMRLLKGNPYSLRSAADTPIWATEGYGRYYVIQGYRNHWIRGRDPKTAFCVVMAFTDEAEWRQAIEKHTVSVRDDHRDDDDNGAGCGARIKPVPPTRYGDAAYSLPGITGLRPV